MEQSGFAGSYVDRDGERPAPGPISFVARLVVAAALTVFGLAAFTAYESFVLGLPVVREEPALFTPFHLVRSAFAAGACMALVAIVARGADGSRAIPLRSAQRAGAWSVTLSALAATFLFVASPASFGELAMEDRPLEWASALLLFAGAAAFGAQFVRRSREGGRGLFGLALCAGFATLLFLMAMEEISWMQRVVGFETPAEMAELNWQGEFNFHNIQTDLSETLYYTGAALFLIALPLLSEAAPVGRALAPFSAFVPSRFVAAASAPVAIFNYGHWNLLPVQMTSFLAIFVLLAFAAQAARRGDRSERRLFLFLAAATAAGQAAFLALGPAMTQIHDATEYKELYIALGLALFAWESGRRRGSRVCAQAE